MAPFPPATTMTVSSHIFRHSKQVRITLVSTTMSVFAIVRCSDIMWHWYGYGIGVQVRYGNEKRQNSKIQDTGTAMPRNGKESYAETFPVCRDVSPEFPRRFRFQNDSETGTALPWTFPCFLDVHINVAVQTDNGLYVPVIKDADKKGLSAISEDVKILANKARENNLKSADYEGSTFTFSNLGGPFAIKQFCAIINPPQAGILAVGSAERRVVPGSVDGESKFASYMSVTLSCDHRVIDGM
ncbi:hypothetical protein E3N88_40992 [Mikania micrantha]|uniref:2-oxoacid dehydrogenase acyltransferase catalytic domain-containing protein n=1 Tax=Mikania micrantha TaxID=192012 RepID=A0A5N6LPA3_9ASTR|nr:hypothetical protein E3N88_40992 [Mikania micrantha]